MAASRHAARKLLLLLRAHPASSPAPGSNCGRASSPASRHARKADEEAKILRFQKELQAKKQEMYDLLSEVEDNRYYMPSASTLGVIIDRIQNVKLLMNLSVDVSPKPFDSRWKFYRQGRKFIAWSVYVASAVVTVWITSLESKRIRKEADLGERVTENQDISPAS
jgi:hypothetical protein